MTKPKFINSIRELGKAYRDKRGRRPQAPVPNEFCPECYSLKRKPNKECVNHEKYWIGTEIPAVGSHLTLERVVKLYQDVERVEFQDAIDRLVAIMVRKIANKHIKVEDTHEGRIAQRHWYLIAQKMLKRLVEEYEKSLKVAYR